MSQLIQTSDIGNNGKHTAVPSTNSSAFIVSDNGKIKGSQTLPVKVQNNIAVENISFSDKLTNDATTGKHGLLPKLSGIATQFLNGLGTWSVPAKPDNTEYFGNIWWVRSGETVIIEETRENVVSNMLVQGSLMVYGRLKIIG